MNIRELLEWRKQCYFCREDLVLFPSMGGLSAGFSFKDGFFDIKSPSFHMQIDMESGQLISIPDHPTMNLLFLKSTHLALEMKCVKCRSLDRYSYTGRVKNWGDGYAWVCQLSEYVSVGELGLYQNYKLGKYAEITKRGKAILEIPLIDLTQVDPVKLKTKLKTLLTFS